jgi:hypothetical protein
MAMTGFLKNSVRALEKNFDNVSSKEVRGLLSGLNKDTRSYFSKNFDVFEDAVNNYASHAKAYSAADLTKSLESAASSSIDDQVRGLRSVVYNKNLSAAEKLEQGKAFMPYRDNIISHGQKGAGVINEYDSLTGVVKDSNRSERIAQKQRVREAVTRTDEDRIARRNDRISKRIDNYDPRKLSADEIVDADRKKNNEQWMRRWENSQAFPEPKEVVQEPVKKYNVNGTQMTLEEVKAGRARNQGLRSAQHERFTNSKKITPENVDRATTMTIKDSMGEEVSQDVFDQRVSDNLSNLINSQHDNMNNRQNDMNARLEAKSAVKRANTERGVEEAAMTSDDVKPNRKKSVEDVMTKKQKYIMEKEGYKYDYDNLNKSYTDQDKLREHISSLTGDSVDSLTSEEAMRASLQASLRKRSSNANLMDDIGYYKVPQMAAGIGTTAWLVSRLNNSKGQMSNAQLYGQQQY